jgi:Copper transport outer membrane protein, MctB
VIDFRYHIVSIVAVFLALAVGVVLGSATLNGPITKELRKSVVALRHEENSQISQNQSLRHQNKSDQEWAQGAGPVLLSHLLAGERVVLVRAPGAPGDVTDGVTQALTQAGAKVTGQVNVQAKFFDPKTATRDDLSLLTQRLTPSGVSLRSGTVQSQAAQLIASAILTQDGIGQPVTGSQDSAGAAILSGFASGGFLSVSAPSMVRATLAVVIIPASPPAANDSSQTSQGLVTLSQQLNGAAQATVVTGSMNGSGPGSAIELIRSASNTGGLSTVDNADTTSGQIVVAQALYELLAKAKPASYGTGSGASAVGPSPMPTPAPSPSVSPSGTAGGTTAAQRTARPSASPSASRS